MAGLNTEPNRLVRLPRDVYRIQRRPGTRQLVINDQYRGLLVIDPVTGETLASASFPGNSGQYGVIDYWCFSSNGNSAAVFNRDSSTMSLVSFVDLSASAVAIPPSMEAIEGIRYIWDDRLIIGDQSLRFYEVRAAGSGSDFISLSSIAARQACPKWRAALDRLPPRSNAVKVEPREGMLLYGVGSGGSGRVGVLDWHEPRNDFSLPVSATSSRLAVRVGAIFLAAEQEIQEWSSAGALTDLYRPPPGYQFHDVEYVPADQNTDAFLAALCVAVDYSDDGVLALYNLPG